MSKLEALTKYYETKVDFETGLERKQAFTDWKKDLERYGVLSRPHKDAVKKNPETKTESPPTQDAHGGYSFGDANRDQAFDNK